MKGTAGASPRFGYSAPYWTNPDTTLNAADVSLDDEDAKYFSFNDIEIVQAWAHWPDIATGISDWFIGPFPPIRAIDLFQVPRIMSTTPRSEANWNAEYFSFARGNGLYSLDFVSRNDPDTFNIRWGYSWNDEENWGALEQSNIIEQTRTK